MFDIFLESAGSIAAAVIFVTVLRGIRHPSVRAQPGTRQVIIGFGLLLFSFMIDITDNFPSLNHLMVIGDTEYQALLEKVFGKLLGLCFLALGFRRWIPSIHKLANTRKSLDVLNRELDARVKTRTTELECVNHKLTIEISERQKAQEQLKHQALHDDLTTLPNRYALRDFLTLEIDRAKRHHFISALFFFDLDKFKLINDLLGHETGDSVLKITAERLLECRGKADFVGRLGGDEFVLVCSDLGADREEATERGHSLARQIINALDKPMLLSDHKLNVSSCIGIKFFPDPQFDIQQETVSDLLKRADTALYHAKSKGLGTYSSFHTDMQKSVEQRLNLARELREALDQKQLFLHYQPLMTDDNHAFGVEALLRWQHPTRGPISPDEFIPVAEDAGLIDKIGLYVLQHTLADWSHYLADSGSDNNIKLSVNISPSHFLQTDFVNQISNLLAAYEMRHCQLVLEITESVAVQDISDLSAKMEALQQIGVGISLDDFGTGYSSLAYIQQLPFDTLKIDQSFVQDIHQDPNDAAIVEAVLAMAKALDVDVIAEGVETREQRDFLRHRGCHLYQGYYFSKPSSQADLIELGLFR